MVPPCSSESTKPRPRSTPKISDREGDLKLPSTTQTEPGTLFASNLAVTEQSQQHPSGVSIGANRTAFGATSSRVRNKRCTSFSVASRTAGSNEVRTSELADRTRSAAALFSHVLDVGAVPRPKPACCSSSKFLLTVPPFVVRVQRGHVLLSAPPELSQVVARRRIIRLPRNVLTAEALEV